MPKIDEPSVRTAHMNVDDSRAATSWCITGLSTCRTEDITDGTCQNMKQPETSELAYLKQKAGHFTPNHT